MPTYDDLIELAEICLKQARAAKSRAVATELRRMAKDKLFLTAWRTRGLAIRGGPGCLNRFSASISGASARVRLPSGVAAG